MRILVTTDQWFPDVFGGSARVATDTARHLAARGHEVTVLAPRHPGRPTETIEGSLTVRRLLPRGRVPQTFSDPVSVFRIARRLPRSYFDVLLAHEPSNAVGLLAARLDLPLVLVFHASIPRELRFLRARVPFGRTRVAATVMAPPLALLERAAVRRATSILVLSRFSESLLHADHPCDAGKARLVCGGVDINQFSPGDGPEAARRRLGLPLEETVLFTARRLEPRMGLEHLLEAVRYLLRSRELRLAVAGSGMSEAKLRRVAVEIGIAGRVDFLGRVSDETLRDWYRAADLFVLPTVAYEGFGIATVEALASGTPVVGTSAGATPELLGPLDRRLIATSARPETLAETISIALTIGRQSFRSRCREYAVSHYDWTRTIVAWERELAAVCHTHSRSDGQAIPSRRSHRARGDEREDRIGTSLGASVERDSASLGRERTG